MMKKAIQKLHGRTGESIGETLVALLISALALLMLAGAISSAGRIITRNKEAMTAYYSTEQAELETAWTEKVAAAWESLDGSELDAPLEDPEDNLGGNTP